MSPAPATGSRSGSSSWPARPRVATEAATVPRTTGTTNRMQTADKFAVAVSLCKRQPVAVAASKRAPSHVSPQPQRRPRLSAPRAMLASEAACLQAPISTPSPAMLSKKTEIGQFLCRVERFRARSLKGTALQAARRGHPESLLLQRPAESSAISLAPGRQMLLRYTDINWYGEFHFSSQAREID